MHARPGGSPRWAARLYGLNAVLLVVHEIDSAYWHEWNLFHLPGGIQFFLLLHLPLLALVLWGFRQTVLWARGARVAGYLLAAAGIFAFSVHTAFITAGAPGFRLPVSQIVLWSTLVVSLAEVAVVLRSPVPGAPEATPFARSP
jgi:hypothetical protein